MSEIRATTISDSAGTGPITLTGQSAAKAWSEFTTSATIRGSFNVSSMVDEGVGFYKTNLTNSMSDARYAAVGGVANYNAYLTTTDKTTSSFKNNTSRDDNSSRADLADMDNVAHGDLA